MGGGKSSSSSKSSQNITETVTSADASGVVTADNFFQGQTVNYSDAFGPEVQQAFSDLIDLSSDAGNLVGNAFQAVIDLANKSVDAAGKTSTTALEQVSTRIAQQENPNLSTVQSLVPIMMIVAVVAGVYFIKKR